MALLPKNLSFSRQILPIIAVIGLILAAFYIFAISPDRDLAGGAVEIINAPVPGIATVHHGPGVADNLEPPGTFIVATGRPTGQVEHALDQR